LVGYPDREMVKLRSFVAVTVLAVVGVGTAAGSVESTTAVRATLASPSGPGAMGVFVAHLTGTSLA